MTIFTNIFYNFLPKRPHLTECTQEMLQYLAKCAKHKRVRRLRTHLEVSPSVLPRFSLRQLSDLSCTMWEYFSSTKLYSCRITSLYSYLPYHSVYQDSPPRMPSPPPPRPSQVDKHAPGLCFPTRWCKWHASSGQTTRKSCTRWIRELPCVFRSQSPPSLGTFNRHNVSSHLYWKNCCFQGNS